jgi:hypothetical protein
MADSFQSMLCQMPTHAVESCRDGVYVGIQIAKDVGFIQHDKTEDLSRRTLSLRPFWIFFVEWLILLFSPCLVSRRRILLKVVGMESVGWMEEIYVGRMEEEGR